MPDDSTPGTLRSYAGGVGRNIAENLTRLGFATSMVSAVGDDGFGQQVLGSMDRLGIDVSNVSIQSDWASASYTAVHDHDGELLYAISDMRLFDDFLLPVDSENVAKEGSIQQIVDVADLVVVDANLPASVLSEIAAQCDSSTMLYADAVSRSKCTRLSGVLSSLSLLKVNRAEAIALTGEKFTDDEALLNAIHQLGPEQVLMTSGEEGVVLSINGVVHRIGVLPDIEIVSTSGAGDAMISGVIAATLTDLSVSEQLEWGMRAAAETLQVYSACSDRLSCQLLQQ